MRKVVFVACALLGAISVAFAQPSTDSLIEHSLSYVDLPPFVQTGPPQPMKPRLGLYFHDVPVDTIKAMTHGAETCRGSQIWHVAPHWSADNAGLMIGDIVLRVNGLTLEDSVYGADDVLNTRISKMHTGDTLVVDFLRKSKPMRVTVPLTGGKPLPARAYTEPAGLGPVRTDSWLQNTLKEKHLTAYADTIAKQIAGLADMDYCDRPFTARPDPFRLNAVTYLDHFPLRVGAMSRLIDQSVWDSIASGQGLAGALAAAAYQLGVTPATSRFDRPHTVDAMKRYLDQVETHVAAAVTPIGPKLANIVEGLAQLLNVEHNWEDEVDTTTDPVKQLQVRTATEDKLVELLGAADKMNLSEMTVAAQMFAALADTNWITAFASTFDHTAPIAKKIPGVDGDVLAYWDSPYDRCVIGGRGANRYSGNFAFIFDIGGNDEYDLPACRYGSARLVVDVSGNDVYRGNEAAGSGVGCVDALIDRSGDDTYRSEDWSQGAGCLGVGILADFGGDDIYTSHWCSQGAAFLGIGLLYDHAGSDHYTSDVYSQGFAYSKGFGMILENGGNDSYRAGWKYPDDRWPNRAHLAMSQGFGYGMRPWSTGVGTSGGIGLLSDRQGDDVYDAGIFSQGGSYWYALGILHDRQGADRYSAGQYSQGSGIHLSFASLLDDGGDDSYDAYAWLEQGNAHDWSAGCLEDWDGKDTYRSSGASQGCGFFVSFAYLLDSHGDDRYYIKQSDTTNSQGGGNFIPPRHSGSLGILLDLGKSEDWYSDTRIKPGEAVVKSQTGITFDDGEPEKK